MTIREIYEWAKKHGYLDIEVAKHSNMHFYEIKNVAYVAEEIPGTFGEKYNYIVVD